MSIECATPVLQLFRVPYVERESLDPILVDTNSFLFTVVVFPCLRNVFFPDCWPSTLGALGGDIFLSSVSRSRMTSFGCLLIINVDATHYLYPTARGMAVDGARV